MKDLLAKLKGKKFKQLALEHGEKAVLGLTGLFVLVCLAMTSWSGYARQPEELAAKSKESEAQLIQNPWPEQQKKDYEVVDLTQRAQQQLVETVVEEKFAYDKPMSFKLFPREQPISEPALVTVEEPLAKAGSFVMEEVAVQGMQMANAGDLADPGANTTKALEPAEAAEGEDTDTVRRDKGSAGGLAGAAGPAAAPVAQPAGEAGGRGANKGQTKGAPPAPIAGQSPGTESNVKARGIRYVSVVGVVNYWEQMQKMMDAEHLDSITEAADYIEYLDFKIERQRAVAGNDPWSGPWKLLDIQTAQDVLQEAASFDPDVVSSEETEPVFTMPLPGRVNGYWSPRVVSHPRLKALSEEMQKAEIARLQATKELFDEKGLKIEAPATKKGFAKNMLDAGSMRRELGAAKGFNPQDLAKRTSQHLADYTNATMGAQTAMAGGLPADQRGGGLGTAGHAKLLLFRYLDFAVEPGDCYRYRIKLELRNPNFELGLDQVQEASVADGETRWTDWSTPTPPVLVEKDVEYFLAKVPRTQNRPKPEALIEVIQWDPRVGTLIDGTLKMVFGQFVGGRKKVPVLNVAVPSLEEEEALFASKDVLVDSAGAPALAASEHADLKLGAKEWKELFDDGKLDLAVTVNPSGDLIGHNPVSVKGEIQRGKKRIDKERQPYNDLVAQDDAASANPLERMSKDGGKPGDKDKKGPKKDTRMKNPLKADGMAGAVPAAMPAMGPAGTPANAPTRGRAGR